MRKLVFAAALLAAPLFVSAASAQAPVAAPTLHTPAHYTAASTLIGTLRADPAASRVVDQVFPGLFASKELTDGLADRFTLSALTKFHPDIFTDARLAQVDAGLAKLPAK